MPYKTITIPLDINEVAKAFHIDEQLVRQCFSNGHYSRGILAAALCEELNRQRAVEREKKKTEDPSYEVFGDYYYDVNYEELGEKISLEKKNKEGEVLEKCSFYDLKLDKGHYGKPFIFAEVFVAETDLEVHFHVPKRFHPE